MNNDLISREDLKKAIHNFFYGLNHTVTEEDIQAYIDATPTVTVDERPHGKWIISEIRCPFCLEYFQLDCYATGELKECPICGAKMDGGEE